MKALAISEVRKRLPSLVREIAATRETLLITRHGKAPARRMPLDLATAAEAVERYPLRGLPLEMSDDFDEPMPGLWEAIAE